MVRNQNQPNTSSDDQELTTNPADDIDLEAERKELEEREAKAAERERAAADALAKAQQIESRVDEKMDEINAKLAELSRDANKDLVARTNQEKADLVARLQNEAYGDRAGELEDFTPLVSMANVTQAGVISYERGISYQVPKQVKEDLQRRQADHLDYKENLHIRNENILPSGTISGAGK